MKVLFFFWHFFLSVFMGSYFNRAFSKLKERKFFRTLIIYLGGAWVAMQVIEMFVKQYELSGFIFDMSLILAVVGIPGALIIAWFHGKSGMQKVSKVEIGLHSILLVVAVVIGVITYDVQNNDDYYVPEHGENTIAVLPFENMSGIEKDEYFSDGITDDIITHLSKIENIQVISRYSVMDYKNTKLSLNAIASKLKVNVILVGRVQKVGNKVRISVQLSNVETDEIIWAEIYDREMVEVFAVQSDVARKIAKNLRIKLSPEEEQRIETRPTANLDAYDFYSQGRDYYNLYQDGDNEIAIDLFKEALKLDPDYAMAYAGLADAYAQRVLRFHGDKNWLDTTIILGLRAIDLDPELAEGYKALGLGLSYKGYISKAIEANLNAIDRNPNFFPSINNLGVSYGRIGELDKQIPLFEKAIALAPLVPIAYVQLGEVYSSLGFDEKAIGYIEKSLDMKPDFTESYYALGRMHIQRGELIEAYNITTKGLEFEPDDPGLLTNMGQIEIFRGRVDNAETFLEDVYDLNLGVHSLMDPIGSSPGYLGYVYLESDKPIVAEVLFNQIEITLKDAINAGNEYYKCKLELGRVYAIQNNKEEALKWLALAFEDGWYDYRLALIDPTFGNIREEQSFKDLIDKMRRRLTMMRKAVARQGLV